MKAMTVKFDSRTEKNLATLNPKVLPEIRTLVLIAKELAVDMGLDVKVISGNRTWDEQNALYAKGRTTGGRKVTNARGGYSNHNYGLAIDFGLFRGFEYLDSSDEQASTDFYKLVAESAKANNLNIKWGGSWKSFPDPPHFEYRTPYSMSEKRKIVSDGKEVV